MIIFITAFDPPMSLSSTTGHAPAFVHQNIRTSYAKETLAVSLSLSGLVFPGDAFLHCAGEKMAMRACQEDSHDVSAAEQASLAPVGGQSPRVLFTFPLLGPASEENNSFFSKHCRKSTLKYDLTESTNRRPENE